MHFLRLRSLFSATLALTGLACANSTNSSRDLPRSSTAAGSSGTGTSPGAISSGSGATSSSGPSSGNAPLTGGAGNGVMTPAGSSSSGGSQSSDSGQADTGSGTPANGELVPPVDAGQAALSSADLSPEASTLPLQRATPCRYPAEANGFDDASNSGCRPTPTSDLCVVSGDATINVVDGGGVYTCHPNCDSSQFQLVCSTPLGMGAGTRVPVPAASLACAAIGGPEPSNSNSYCCSCAN